MINREQESRGLRYVLYARRSIAANRTEKDSRVSSIESQIFDVKELAERDELNVVAEFYETVSASEPDKRPEFKKMIEFIEKGKANAILSFKADRLSRNPVDEGKLRYMLQKGYIKNIKCTDKDMYPEDNALLSSVEFGVANQYILDLKKHIRRGQNDSLRRGFRPCLAPVGYKNTKHREKGMPETCEVDPEIAPIIQKVFKTIISREYTPHQVFIMAVKQWGLQARRTKRYPKGRPISVHGFYNILRNTFYYGEFRWPADSEPHMGAHTPLISRNEFDEVQRILDRGGARYEMHEHAYVGLMRCPCGARITCEKKFKTQKNGNRHEYSYYRCTGRMGPCSNNTMLRVEKLENLIIEYLSSIQIAPAFHEWAIEELKRQYGKESHDKDSIIFQQRKALRAVEEKMKVLFEMRLGGEVNSEEFKEKKAEYEQEVGRLKGEVDMVDQNFKTWLDDAERLLTFAERAKEEFVKGSLQKKRSIMSALGSEHLLDSGVLTIKTEKPLLLMREMASAESRFEPLTSVGNNGYFDKNDPEFSQRWRCGKSNPGPNLASSTSLRRIAAVEDSAGT